MDGAPRKQNKASACVPACHTCKHDPQVSSTLTHFYYVYLHAIPASNIHRCPAHRHTPPPTQRRDDSEPALLRVKQQR